MPPGLHSKNAIESKHGIICIVFLRLKEAPGEKFDPLFGVYKSVPISNDLCGNENMSFFELSKRLHFPTVGKPTDVTVPDDVSTAYDKLRARRKLALTMISKLVTEVPLAVGDMVEIYQSWAMKRD